MKAGQGKKYRVDFGGVEETVGKRSGKRIAEGDYILKVLDVPRVKNKAGDAYYFNWKLQVVSDSRGGKSNAGTTFYYITSLKPEALFNLRNMIYACTNGKKNVAGSVIDFDPSTYIGAKIAGVVEDDEYGGKIRSQVTDVGPLKDLEVSDEDEDEDEEVDELEDVEDEDEDEEPVKKPKKKKKKAVVEDDEDDL